MSEVYHIRPFREGDGRTQLQYPKQLAARAGYKIDLTKLDDHTWVRGSISAIPRMGQKDGHGRVAVLIHREIKEGNARPPRGSASLARPTGAAKTPMNPGRGGRGRSR